MKKTISGILVGVGLFYALAYVVFVLLRQNVYDIDGPAPDALHLVGFIALIPMIGAAGGKFADRKIAYIKNDRLFKPIVVGAFAVMTLSLVPWILSFFIADAVLVYIDWSIVLTATLMSFVVFSLFLYVFLKE